MTQLHTKDAAAAALATEVAARPDAALLDGQRGPSPLTIQVHAPSYAGNRIGASTMRDVLVVLPGDYDASADKRYAVLYLLHGFGRNAARHRFWLGEGYAAGLHIVDAIREFEALHGLFSVIVVCPDGGNDAGGSMWEDSPIGGGAATFVARDLVSAVDRRFRTCARPEARGIAGHSMGGQGAMKIAATHPEVFSAVYSVSGMMAFSEDELLRYGAHWLARYGDTEAIDYESLDEMSSAYLAMAIAYCWDAQRPPHYADFPVRKSGSGVELKPEAAARFRSAWPHPVIERNADGARRLRALKMDVGTDDEFEWGLEANRRFVQMLQQLRVPFSYDEYRGTHSSKVAERMKQSVLPFFSTLFSAGEC